jgi:type I restriction enzyme S subunit
MSSYYEKMLATGEVKCIDEEVPFEIPQGWEWCRLNDLYNFIDYRGATPHKLSKGIPLITAKNVKQGYLDYTVKDFISSEEYSNRLSRGVSHKGDILFTTEAPLGNVAIADLDVYSAGQRLITLQAYIQCFTNNDMFMFFMLSPLFQELVMSYKTGTTVAGIKASKLKEVLIPTPPISEQSRIVKKLQTLLPFIEKYSRSQTLLNIFNTEIKDKLRKSFLQEAIRGKLVPQIAEDGTAQELLEQIKAEKQELVKEGKLKRSALNDSVIFRGGDNRYYEKIGKKYVDITEEIPFEIPASWAWCHLNDIAESDLGKTMNKGQNSGELVPYLCSINVYWNKIDLSKIKQAQFTEIELAKYLLQKNDLLICEGGDIGRAAIWDINETIYYQNALHRVRFYGKIFPKFFLYILSLYKALGLLDKKSKGMTIKHFTKSALNSIVIPLPPLLEQKRIIEKIEQLMQLLK